MTSADTTATPISFAAGKRDANWNCHLNLLRGVAALNVFSVHAVNLFLVDSKQVITPNPFLDFMYALGFGYGAPAVMCFFVLSGFLVSGSIVSAVRQNRFTWFEYALQRLTRLYLVLLPALLLTFFWDSLGVHLFGLKSIYGGESLGSFCVNGAVPDRLTASVFWGNFAFLQTIKCAPLGSNNPLWSLSNEFWYYIIFPLLFLAFQKKMRILRRIAYVALAMALMWFVGFKIFFFFSIWLFGSALVFIPANGFLVRNFRARTALILTAISLLIIAFLLFQYGVTLERFEIFGVVCTVLMYALLQDREVCKNQLYAKVSSLLSGFSYTLYLVHMPILFFIRQSLNFKARMQPTPEHLLYLAGIMIAVLVYAYLLSLITEARTDSCRKLIRTWLLGASSKYRALVETRSTAG